jgi:hypothetical protein
MNKIELPLSFVKLIFNYYEIFSKPNYNHFMKVVSGLIMAKHKKTITSIIKIHHMYDKFYNIHRFFNKYKWNVDKLALKTLEIMINILKIKELNLALDDTLIMKTGKCIYGRAIHYNHANKSNTPKYVYGHNWVVIGLIKNIAIFKKWICFPFLSKLFIPREHFGDQSQFKSRIDIAIEMLSIIKEHIKLNITVVTDGLYSKMALVRFSIKNKISLISRLRSDVALYRKYSQPKKRKRGRPRKYGKRISMKRMSQNNHQFEKITLNLYGKEQTIKVRTFRAYWKSAAEMITVFIVKYPKKEKEIINYYFTTDENITAKQAIELIAARWSIETSFKDLKEHFGINNWQVRKEKPVTRSVTVSCITQSLLILWTYIEATKKQLDLWDSLPWYKQKNSISSYDMIKLFENKCITVNINNILSGLSINQQKKQEILKICSLAA